jgi:hypothetical protein
MQSLAPSNLERHCHKQFCRAAAVRVLSASVGPWEPCMGCSYGSTPAQSSGIDAVHTILPAAAQQLQHATTRYCNAVANAALALYAKHDHSRKKPLMMTHSSALAL